MIRYKSFKVRLYPNKIQQKLIDQTIGNCRFLYNQMLNERIKIYNELKNDKEKLYNYKYKTEKEYKQEFEFLRIGIFNSLQQSRIDLEKAYLNFFRGMKKGKKVGFPKFKIRITKVGLIKFKGLSKNFNGLIKSVTVFKSKSGKYFASILVEKEIYDKKIRKSNNIIGIDLGLKEFITCSNGIQIKGIQEKVNEIENKIKKQQKYLSRKILINKKLNIKNSKRREKCRIKLAKLYEYKINYLNHFQWNLVNKLCSENQTICLENLNVKGMIKNRKLSHAIQNINWSSFITKLEQKAKEYNTEIYKVGRFYPSSKTCSNCGKIKQDLKLSDRIFECECGNYIDRDLNASINIKNDYLKNISEEYSDYKHGEIIRPKRIIYNSSGSFNEVFI